MAGSDFSLGTASIGLGVNTDGLTSGFVRAKEMVGSFGGAVGGLLISTTVAAVGLGAATVKMAGDFSASMTQLVTGAGESQSNLKLVSDGILQMAGTTGTSTKDLAAGMYLIESSGQHGAQALTTLQAAAEGAKVGAASLAEVANGVTTIMTDYASANVTAANATNALIEGVALGKVHLGDLSTSMATVLPTASALGIGLNDVIGAMSTMTAEGVPAANAATYLRQTMMSLEAPASAGAKAIAAIGLTTAQVSDEMKVSLPGTLQMIMDHLAATYTVGSPQYIEALKNIAGGSKQMQGMLDLTGTHLAIFKDDVQAVADQVKAGGDQIAGWTLVQGDFNQKMDEARGVIEALGIKIGSVLLPVVSQLMGWLTPMVSTIGDHLVGDVTNLADAFQSVFDPMSQVQSVAKPLADTFDHDAAMVDNLTGAMNPFQQAMFNLKPDLADIGGMFKTVGDVVFNQVIPAVVGLAQKVEPIITDFFNWDEKTHFISTTLHDLGGFVSAVAGDIGNDLVPPIRALLGHLENWLSSSNMIHDALGFLAGAIGVVSSVLGTLIGWVGDFVGGLEKGNPLAVALGIALVTVGTAIAGIKLTEFVLGLQNAFTQAGGLSGILEKFISDTFPNLARSLGLVKTAEVEVGTTAETTMAEGVATGATAAEASLAGIGTTAETTMAEGVATGAVESVTSLAEVGTQAEITADTVKTSSLSMAASIGLIGGAIGLVLVAIPLIQQGLAATKQNMDDTAKGLSTQIDAAASKIHDSFIPEIANVNTMSVAQISDMKAKIVSELEQITGKSQSDAEKMANDWIYGTQQMQTQVSANLATMSQQAIQSAQQLVSGVEQALAQMQTNSASDMESMKEGITSELISTYHLSYSTATQMSSQWSAELQKMQNASPQQMASMRQQMIDELQKTLGLSTQDATNMADQWIAQVMREKDQTTYNVMQLHDQVAQQLQDTEHLSASAASSMADQVIGSVQHMKDMGISDTVAMKIAIAEVMQQITGNAQTWGADMLNAYAAGIEAQIPNLQQSVGQVAHLVQANLGYSLPTEGVLAHSDEWMPDFGDLLTQGLLAQQPKIKAASSVLATAFAPLFPSGGPLLPYLPSIGGYQAAQMAASSGAGGVIENHVYIILDSEQIGHSVVRNAQLRTGMRV